jgi:4-diphosphocytidyl-2-C-methyl-D-erythritol kinase
MLIDVKGGLISVLAPAKLNLFLEVLGKRADGYHEIESLMCPVSLCDTLELRSTVEPELILDIELPASEAQVENDPAWDVPSDNRNLVFRAVKCVREHMNVQSGCRIRLKKSIPAAAGLGGGSSDAAAAVVAAMVAWGRWDRRLAARICSELGSDLNLFLGDENHIGLTLAKGRGEDCETLDISPALDFLVTHPPAGCSTSAVYANWRNSGSIRHSSELIEACRTENLDRIGALLFNALQASARTITPWIDNQLKYFQGNQFRYNAMTGSGSSCFALVTETYTMANVRRAANDAGLSRVYAVKSWTQPSIEEQVRLVSSR